jgi:hypothetical protein
MICTRTGLLILITPHVIRDRSDMRKLSEDMRKASGNPTAGDAPAGNTGAEVSSKRGTYPRAAPDTHLTGRSSSSA